MDAAFGSTRDAVRQRGLRVKDARVASKRKRGCLGCGNIAGGVSSRKPYGRTVKGTAEGEEGSHDLPRGVT
jgi:hypothetical protein